MAFFGTFFRLNGKVFCSKYGKNQGQNSFKRGFLRNIENSVLI
jgi:hypothetical protein